MQHRMLRLVPRQSFDYREMMDVRDADVRLSAVAGAIAEPARTRMPCRLLDGCARTSTELAIVAGVSPSTASVHLVKLAGAKPGQGHAPGTAPLLQLARRQGRRGDRGIDPGGRCADRALRTRNAGPPAQRAQCYDHMAGRLAVALHDSLFELRWLSRSDESSCDMTRKGIEGFAELDVDVSAARRRFACGCLDWSERRSHLAGAHGAALLTSVLRRGWMLRDLDSRALAVTRKGQRVLRQRFGVEP